MDTEPIVEKPLTRRECRGDLGRQDLLEMRNLFAEIASSVSRDEAQHLTLGDFPVSECKVRLASMIPPRTLYAYIARRMGRGKSEIKAVLNVTRERVRQLLNKAQIKVLRVESIVGKEALDDFLDQYAETILCALEERMKDDLAKRAKLWERHRGSRNPVDVPEMPSRNTSFFYLVNGYDVFDRF